MAWQIRGPENSTGWLEPRAWGGAQADRRESLAGAVPHRACKPWKELRRATKEF